MNIANQKSIIIKKEKVETDNPMRYYFLAYQDNLQKAMRELTGNAFKVYVYLCCYYSDYKLSYSPTYLNQLIGISRNGARDALKELQEKKYLIKYGNSDNNLMFYDNPNGKQRRISKGEENIFELLEKHNISFYFDYPLFEDLTSEKGYILRYDFILLNQDNKPYRLIEFDGEQHTKQCFQTPEEFDRRIYLDNLKNKYALDHNIPLVRIPYKERDNITIDLIFGDKYLYRGENND